RDRRGHHERRKLDGIRGRREREHGLAVVRVHEGHEQPEDREDRERDRCLPTAHESLLVHDLPGCGSGRGHLVTAFEAAVTGVRAARGAPGCGSRKVDRTSGGAAMSSTTTDCTTSTMSIGTPCAACIEYPPALRAPNRMPEMNTPHGRDRPSSATVMASKPMPAS